MIDWAAIQAKWQDRWGDDYEAEPDGRPKKFITVAYPYPNSPQHIGHGRTYTLADVHARFYRMQGYNVLFPMGFHYTGTPILGMAKRIESGDAEILKGLQDIYHVPQKDIDTFTEPIKIADYFHKEIKSGMIEMGYSIDWRREFTTISPGYQKFIEWQITTLKNNGRIIQGSHPVGWCPADQNPVSQHDTMGDVEPKIDEKNHLVKFEFGKYILAVTTMRPETIFGVTNLWMNPDAAYSMIMINDKTWIVSQDAIPKVIHLYGGVEAGVIEASQIIGKSASFDGVEIPILGAGFVEPDTGTGIVMSVPAHAPKDYQALIDLGDTGIEPVTIISGKYGDVPARQVCQERKITSQTDAKIEEATKELYQAEFDDGELNERCGKFAGQKVRFARGMIKEWLEADGHLMEFPTLENAPVFCRCGAKCVVKVLDNQWFLDYGNKGWKDDAHACLDGMGILPGNIKTEFDEVIDWLHERACARQHGLGTRLPWDSEWIVESLSDSVIYMAYYTISRFVNEGVIPAEKLSQEFLDYVFLGKGDAAGSGLPAETVEMARKEFEYFYPVDSRHSGRDLVQNHLSFFVLNHVAIFAKKFWPQQIVVNGSVMMDGSKMSKSMGNIIPLRDAIKKYGADPIRLAIISSAELLQDADFNTESISGIQGRLESLLRQCTKDPGQSDPDAEDKWMLAKMHEMIRAATSAVQKMRLREALHTILFEAESDIAWYAKRAGAKERDTSNIIHMVNTARVAMLSPFAPHIAEEMWERLGCEGLVSRSEWPAFEKPDAGIIQSEELLRSTINDIAKIINVTKMKPKKITVYVSADKLKARIYRKILDIMAGSQGNMGAVMKELLADSQTSDAKKIPDFVQKVIKDLHSEPEAIKEAKRESDMDEAGFLNKELPYMTRSEFGIDAVVYSGNDAGIYDPKDKARHARPFKPAILID